MKKTQIIIILILIFLFSLVLIFKLDFKIFFNIINLRTPWLTQTMKIITGLGDWKILLILSVIFSVFFVAKAKWRQIFVLYFSLVLAAIVVWALKTLIQKPRPPQIYWLIPENGSGFPSGHATLAITFYGLLAYFLLKNLKNTLATQLFAFFITIMILLIGFSRLYLGVHAFSDVIGGYMIGMLLSILMIILDDCLKKNKVFMSQNNFLKKSSLIFRK